MKVFAPCFFKDFHCTGSSCADNCCRMGWDIEIDDDTYNRYKSLDSALCQHITCDGGEHYIKQKNGQCPFLDENGLCSVVLRYGEQSISEICSEHPRFYQWFGGYKEAGTGLCCEESARLWLTNAGNIHFSEFHTDEPDDDLGFDPDTLSAVIAARNVLFDILQSPELSFPQKLKSLLIFGLGALSFVIATASGVLFVKFFNLFLKEGNKINPLIGNAGVSAVPDAARISQNVGLEYDPSNYLLMQAMGPNVAGVIGSAVAAGVLLGFLI